VSQLEPMRDHWWWRPGWKIGRSFYTWHITFADQPAAAELVEAYAPALSQLPTLDPVPLRWLHLTMQGIGFTDEVDRNDVDRIVSAAQKRCAQLEPFTVTIGPAHADPETIQMPVRPIEPLALVRQAIRDAIGEVWGAENVPEPADGWRAHVSLGYSNSAGPAEPAAITLAAHQKHSAGVNVSAVSLINLNRDSKAYEWTTVATVHLGQYPM
jgi:2'-5' RNA ligase